MYLWLFTVSCGPAEQIFDIVTILTKKNLFFREIKSSKDMTSRSVLQSRENLPNNSIQGKAKSDFGPNYPKGEFYSFWKLVSYSA